MQSYDGFWLIPNFFFHFFSKAMDKEPGFGQIAEMMSIPVQRRVLGDVNYGWAFTRSFVYGTPRM